MQSPQKGAELILPEQRVEIARSLFNLLYLGYTNFRNIADMHDIMQLGKQFGIQRIELKRATEKETKSYRSLSALVWNTDRDDKAIQEMFKGNNKNKQNLQSLDTLRLRLTHDQRHKATHRFGLERIT